MKFLLLIFFAFTFHISLICQAIDIDSINLMKEEACATPRIKGSFVTIYNVFKSSRFDTLSSSCQNELAIQYYKGRLNAMKLYLLSVENEDWFLAKIGDLSIDGVIDGIENFEFLTGIESESEANFMGKYQPTRNDVFKWEEWFQQNKEFLCWDDEYNVIYLREK